MSVPDRMLSMLGIAMKAGSVVSGETATENAIKSGNACLVIIAGDASDNTRKHFSDMCAYRDIPLEICSDKESLGRAIGRESRSNLAVTDPSLAAAITERITTSRKECDI